MTEESINNFRRKVSQSSDNESEDSLQFQELNTGDNQSIKRENDLEEDQTLGKSSECKNQQRIKIYEEQLQDKIIMLEKQLKIRQQQLENEKKDKNQYYRLYQEALHQSSQLKQKIEIDVIENEQLKDINTQFKKLCKELKQENQEYVQKINFLQKKIQFQKEDMETKFNVIKRNMQPITRVPLKNVENQNLVKLLASKFGEVEKIVNKLKEIDQMIIEKNPKGKNLPDNCDVLQEKFITLEKVQNLLLKQQTKINALKEYNVNLEQELNEFKKNSNSISSGIGKIFNPVMKFCKAEELKQPEIKKKKENI